MNVATPRPRYRPSSRAAACRRGTTGRSTISAIRSSDSRVVTPTRLRPVIIASGGSPRVTTLRSRSSSGSMPTSWATMSSRRSRVNVSAAHGPRYATYVALFVTVALNVKPSASILYGPGSIDSMSPLIMAPMPGYAPVSTVMSTFKPRMSPSFVTAASAIMLSSRA